MICVMRAGGRNAPQSRQGRVVADQAVPNHRVVLDGQSHRLRQVRDVNRSGRLQVVRMELT